MLVSPARPGQFRNRETTLPKICSRPAVCPKSCKLECKREHKKRTTVLLSWSTNPTTNSKNQHKKKQKTRAQKKAQEHHNCFATQSTNPTTNSKNQHKKKHKLEHKKSTRTPQLFCNPEHKPDHKLQKPAQGKAQTRMLYCGPWKHCVLIRKKHKLEHKKSTRTPQLFCNPEHKPDHKLQKPAQEKSTN